MWVSSPPRTMKEPTWPASSTCQRRVSRLDVNGALSSAPILAALAPAQEEIAMSLGTKNMGALILRPMVVLALLGCSRAVNAAGTWSVISLPQEAGDVYAARAMAADTAGNLYVADQSAPGRGRIQKRDEGGNWSVIATEGGA